MPCSDSWSPPTRGNVVKGSTARVIPDDGVAYFLRWIVHGAIIWHQRYEGLIRA